MGDVLYKTIIFTSLGVLGHQLMYRFVEWLFAPQANRDYLKSVLEKELGREITEADIDNDIGRTANRWGNAVLIGYTIVILLLSYKGVV